MLFILTPELRRGLDVARRVPPPPPRDRPVALHRHYPGGFQDRPSPRVPNPDFSPPVWKGGCGCETLECGPALRDCFPGRELACGNFNRGHNSQPASWLAPKRQQASALQSGLRPHKRRRVNSHGNSKPWWVRRVQEPFKRSSGARIGPRLASLRAHMVVIYPPAGG